MTALLQAPRNVRPLKEPTVIRYSEATRFLWGDEGTHPVSDWIYGGGGRTSSFIYALRPGEHFRVSDTWKPLYNEHRFYYVYQGMLAIQDPESGEVAVAQEGEAIHWRGNKWHFGYNFGQKEGVYFDVWAPGGFPLEGTEVEASRMKPDLKEVKAGRYELLGKWPSARPEVEAKALREGGMVTLRRSDCLTMIEGEKSPVPVSIFISTDEITAGFVDLLPGQMADPESHPGDEAILCMKGRLNVYLPDTYEWFELHPKDSMFIPEGFRHQYCSMSHEPVELFFTVAPRYR